MKKRVTMKWNCRRNLNGDDFFSTSYLAYGVDQFRERLWDTWVERQQQEEKQYQDACGDKYD